MISTGRDKAGTRNRSNRPIAVGSKPLDELIHDLSNQMNVLTGAAWVLLTHTEHVERLDLLLQQVERATDLVCAMRDIVVLQKRIEDDGDREKTA